MSEKISTQQLLSNKDALIHAYRNGIPLDQMREISRNMLALLNDPNINISDDYPSLINAVLENRGNMYTGETQARLIFSLLTGRYYGKGAIELLTNIDKWDHWEVFNYIAITTTSPQIKQSVLHFRYKKLLATIMMLFRSASGDIRTAVNIVQKAKNAYFEILFIASLVYSKEQLITLIREMMKYTNHVGNYKYKYFRILLMVVAEKPVSDNMKTAIDVISCIEEYIQNVIIEFKLFTEDFISQFPNANKKIVEALISAGMAPDEESLRASRQANDNGDDEEEIPVGPAGTAYNYRVGTTRDWTNIVDVEEIRKYLEELKKQRTNLLKKLKQARLMASPEIADKRKRAIEAFNSVAAMTNGFETQSFNTTDLSKLEEKLRIIDAKIALAESKVSDGKPAENESSDDDIPVKVPLVSAKVADVKVPKQSKPQSTVAKSAEESDDDIPVARSKAVVDDSSDDQTPAKKATAKPAFKKGPKKVVNRSDSSGDEAPPVKLPAKAPVEKSPTKTAVKTVAKKNADDSGDDSGDKTSKKPPVKKAPVKKDMGDSDNDEPITKKSIVKKVITDSGDDSPKKPSGKKVAPMPDSSDDDKPPSRRSQQAKKYDSDEDPENY